MNPIKIALDGPGGAGKSSVAKKVAERLGIIYVDTGAMYRSIGLYMKRHGIDPSFEPSVIDALPGIRLSYSTEGTQRKLLLSGEEVGDEIRTEEISQYASKVSAIPAVREFLLGMQREIASQGSVIMDGRDIGTVIFPDAEVKIFLTASPEARAERRTRELNARGVPAKYEDVLAEMNLRDKNDTTRAIAPLKAAPDAVLVDTSEMTFAQSVEAVLSVIREKTDAERHAIVQHEERAYRRLYRFAARLIRFLFRIRITGQENIPIDGGYIVCANHISLIDVFTIGACIPRPLHYLAKKELFSVPLLSPIIRSLGAIPLDRAGSDVGAIRRSIDVVKRGELLSVFPQGHRQKGKNPADTQIKNGVGLIAYRAGSGMIPVCIKIKKQKYRIFRRVDVLIGKPISYEELGFTNGGNEEYSLASQTIFRKICELGGYEPSAPTGDLK